MTANANSQVKAPTNWNLWAWVLLLGGGLYAYHRLTSDAKDAASAAASALNPHNPNNIAATAANTFTELVTGGKYRSPVDAWWSWSGNQAEQERLSAPISLDEINAARRKQGKGPVVRDQTGRLVPVQTTRPNAKPKNTTPPPGKTRLVRKYGRGGYYNVWE